MKKHFSFANRNTADGTAPDLATVTAAGFTEISFSLAGGDLSPKAVLAAREGGLLPEALLLPSEAVNLLWETPEPKEKPEGWLPTDGREPNEASWEALRDLYDYCFTIAARLGVARVILLPSMGLGVPAVSQVGLFRLRELAALARAKDVRILIENEKSAPHFAAATRAVADGFHGVSFSPAKAWRYYGTSALPSYAAEHLQRLSLDDGKGEDFGYLPFDGDTDFQPFARSMASVHFRGTMAISPDRSLFPYSTVDGFAFLSDAYDKLSTLLRMIKEEEGRV